jgi:hypothetical protein
MSKPKPIRSPILVRGKGVYLGDLVLKYDRYREVICLEYLEKYVVIPEEAKTFQVEISLTQWSDDSGESMWVKRDSDDNFVWAKDKVDWDSFYETACIKLRRVVKQKCVPVKIFFRLLYDE